MKEKLGTRENVVLVLNRMEEKTNIAPHDALLILTNHKTGEVQKIWGRNIVTNAGDVWYAQSACSETPTNAFANLYLATACGETSGVPVKDSDYSDFTLHAGSEKAKSTDYPKTNDADVQNTGSGTDIVTWLFEYTSANGPFVDVTHSFISIASASGTDPIMNGYKWTAAWSKDDSTQAKIFTNHEFLGA